MNCLPLLEWLQGEYEESANKNDMVKVADMFSFMDFKPQPRRIELTNAVKELFPHAALMQYGHKGTFFTHLRKRDFCADMHLAIDYIMGGPIEGATIISTEGVVSEPNQQEAAVVASTEETSTPVAHLAATKPSEEPVRPAAVSSAAAAMALISSASISGSVTPAVPADPMEYHLPDGSIHVQQTLL